MSKPTYSDIAARAGVGTATVERVLNGRGGVSDRLVARVVSAARALDWPGRLPCRHRGVLRIEVVMVRPDTSFYRRLSEAFKWLGSTLDRTVQLHVTFVDEADPGLIARHIEHDRHKRAALIVSTPDHPEIARALDSQIRSGLPVVQIVTEIIDNAPVVEIDNLAAGRMAGHLMASMIGAEGSVLALCHSGIYRAHRERLSGFGAGLTLATGAMLAFRQVAFTADSGEGAVQAVSDALVRWPDLVGVYNCGGGNGRLLEWLRMKQTRLFFVGHELSPAARVALADGTADVILDQRPEAQARRAVERVLNGLGMAELPDMREPLLFTTYTRANI